MFLRYRQYAAKCHAFHDKSALAHFVRKSSLHVHIATASCSHTGMRRFLRIEGLAKVNSRSYNSIEPLFKVYSILLPMFQH